MSIYIADVEKKKRAEGRGERLFKTNRDCNGIAIDGISPSPRRFVLTGSRLEKHCGPTSPSPISLIRLIKCQP